MIPYNTDAPLYHWPLVTVGLIACNTFLFFALPPSVHAPLPVERAQPLNGRVENNRMEWDDADFQIPDENEPQVLQIDLPNRRGVRRYPLRLQYGEGVHPTQWITSPFLHSGFLQLIINMLALWALGLVIEGKVGWWRFLLLYLGIGFTHAAIAQLLMLLSQGGSSLGGNATILGLLGLAIVWAPKNHFDVWFGYYFGSHEVSILMYGFLQFALGLVALAFGGYAIDGGWLQALGLFLGLGTGWWWLKRGWVDCEGWDLVNVLKGRHTQVEKDEEVEREARQLVRSSLKSNAREKAPQQKPKPVASQPPPSSTVSPSRKPPQKNAPAADTTTTARTPRSTVSDQPSSPPDTHAPYGADPPTLHQDLEQLITDGNWSTALKLLAKLERSGTTLELSQPAVDGLIRQLLAAGEYLQAIPWMEEHIRRFSRRRLSLQLSLAKVFLHLERPHKAKAVLRDVDRQQLNDETRTSWRHLVAHAQQQINTGTIELRD